MTDAETHVVARNHLHSQGLNMCEPRNSKNTNDSILEEQTYLIYIFVEGLPGRHP